MLKKIANLSLGDNPRSIKANKNILVSGAFKAADTLIYLLLVPLTLGYLNAYEYGVWLTLNSILGWINSFDIGLGNGLRNKLAEAIARNDNMDAKKYVSTTFFMLIIIALIILIVGSIIINIVNWNDLLNLQYNSINNIKEIIYVSFCFFCLNFVFKFIGNIYQAMQVPSAMYIMNFCAHCLALFVIYILTKTLSSSLFLIALVYSAAPPLIYLIAYPITFRCIFKNYAPSIKHFDISAVKELFNLSIVFFLLQIAGLILFSLTNLIISNLFGPEEVTPYNIAYRYFSIIPMLINIIFAPIWSATTDAYIKGDIEWITNNNRKMRRLLLIIMVILFIMVIFSPVIYKIWIQNKVEIPFVLSILMAIYNFIIVWSHCYGYFLNGMGKLRVQVINTITVAFLFYPLCKYLGGLYQVPGVLLGMCLVNLSGAILNTIQFHKLTNNTATGLWTK